MGTERSWVASLLENVSAVPSGRVSCPRAARLRSKRISPLEEILFGASPISTGPE
ncbi:hypothetical protein BQ8420_12190 [Nocardiopsis sp. JB363]|nr:hypothetical protein BQ8420_12190 [Nocardiopsis sp. JB363]